MDDHESRAGRAPDASTRRAGILHLLAALVVLLAAGWTFLPFWGEDLTRVVPARSEPTAIFFDTRSWLVRRAPIEDQRWVVWAVSRNARTFLERPARIFDAEICHPAARSLTLGEPVLTLGLLGAPAWLATGDPVGTFNFVVIALPLISALAMYLLVHAWTRRPAAALLAALAYAFHAEKLGDFVHPYVTDTAWAVFALYFFERWLREGRWRDLLGLILGAALQMGGSIYPLVGTGVVAGAAALWSCAHQRAGRTRPAQWLVLVGCLGITAILVFSPYLTASELGEIVDRHRRYFLPWKNVLGDVPGSFGFFTVLVAALAFLPRLGRLGERAPSAGDPSTRGLRWALLAGGVLALLLATGGNAGDRLAAELAQRPPPIRLPNPFDWLSALVPVLGKVRAPRFVASGTHLALCVLAGIGAGRVLDALPRRARGLAAGSLVGLALLWVVPGGSALTAQRMRPAPEMLEFLAALADRGDSGPILEIPARPDSASSSASVLLAAYHRRPTSRCYNSFEPPVTRRVEALAARLPAGDALDALRALGFTTLLIHEQAGWSKQPATQELSRELRVNPHPRLTLLQADSGLSAYRIEPSAEPAPSAPPDSSR